VAQPENAKTTTATIQLMVNNPLAIVLIPFKK